MDDAISRQMAIDAIEHITSSMSVCINKDECYGMKRMQRQAVTELANLPSAQPEQRTGTWLVAETHSNWSDFDTFICTNCDAKFEKFEATKFCPNCGARMVDCINVRFVGES